MPNDNQPTRAELDTTLEALDAVVPKTLDADGAVAQLREAFGDLVTEADEAAVRDFVKLREIMTTPASTPTPTPVPTSAPKRGGGKVRRQVQRSQVDPATTSTRSTTEIDEDQVDELPAKVTLAAPYAFYDDDGVLRSWGQGRVVEDPDEIALLVERGAIFEA